MQMIDSFLPAVMLTVGIAKAQWTTFTVATRRTPFIADNERYSCREVCNFMNTTVDVAALAATTIEERSAIKRLFDSNLGDCATPGTRSGSDPPSWSPSSCQIKEPTSPQPINPDALQNTYVTHICACSHAENIQCPGVNNHPIGNDCYGMPVGFTKKNHNEQNLFCHISKAGFPAAVNSLQQLNNLISLV